MRPAEGGQAAETFAVSNLGSGIPEFNRNIEGVIRVIAEFRGADR